MVTVYDLDEKIEVQMGELSFFISPMNMEQKSKIASCTALKSGELQEDRFKIAMLAVKYAIKGCKGLENSDGSDYKLEFSKNGKELTDRCAENILNTPVGANLIRTCNQLIIGIPEFIFDDMGKPIEGIKIVLPKTKAKSRKK